MNATADLRKKNTLAVLKAITHGAATKADVSRRTGLTRMTANTIMNRLANNNILTICGNVDSSGGRKAMLYSINPTAYHIIGVNIGVGEVTIALSDLHMKSTEIRKLEMPECSTPKDTTDKIQKTITEIMKNTGLCAESILGLGITVPGPVDEKNGMIRFLPNLKGWENIPIRDIFQNSVGVPVFVEKDNYASALYLKRRLHTACDSVVSLTIKGGLGTGILLKGSLYRGENGIAGELGHVSVETGGQRCNCGNVGCLESYASDFSIVRDVKSGICSGEGSRILCEDGIDLKRLNIGDVVRAANQGDELCRSVVFKAAKYLGIAVSNAIKFYDPASFIINCKWIREINGVSDEVTTVVNEKCTLMQRQKINLVFHYEQDVYLNGALMLVMEHALEDTADNRLIG